MQLKILHKILYVHCMMNTNTNSYEFQFSIDRKDSNADVQQKLMQLINHSKIGINVAACRGHPRPSHQGQEATRRRESRPRAVEIGRAHV